MVESVCLRNCFCLASKENLPDLTNFLGGKFVHGFTVSKCCPFFTTNKLVKLQYEDYYIIKSSAFFVLVKLPKDFQNVINSVFVL